MIEASTVLPLMILVFGSLGFSFWKRDIGAGLFMFALIVFVLEATSSSCFK